MPKIPIMLLSMLGTVKEHDIIMLLSMLGTVKGT